MPSGCRTTRQSKVGEQPPAPMQSRSNRAWAMRGRGRWARIMGRTGWAVQRKECIPMIQFMSKAAASFIMTDEVARAVFGAAGQEASDRGIWILERLPEILGRLEEASQRSQIAQRAKAQDGDQEEDDRAWGSSSGRGVALHQRLAPVLEMVRRAQAEGQPVVWDRL
ncbi:MAG: DUF1840 domain-containing protein [Betaproteobacteria bacterium]|nr:DUF1840 domain-containing protein [Betaproteobacteria bacterium]